MPRPRPRVARIAPPGARVNGRADGARRRRKWRCREISVLHGHGPEVSLQSIREALPRQVSRFSQSFQDAGLRRADRSALRDGRARLRSRSLSSPRLGFGRGGPDVRGFGFRRAAATEGPIVLPVRQRRRGEGERRLRRPDVPGGAQAPARQPRLPAGPAGHGAEEVQQRPLEGRPAGRRPGAADPAPRAGGQGQGPVGARPRPLRRGVRLQPLGRQHDARRQRGRHAARISSARPVAARVGPGPGQRRRLLPQPGAGLPAERELAEGDPVLGARPEARPERRDGQAADERPLRQRHDRPVGAQRGAGQAHGDAPRCPRRSPPTWRRTSRRT